VDEDSMADQMERILKFYHIQGVLMSTYLLFVL